jgi:hypothetical protein
MGDRGVDLWRENMEVGSMIKDGISKSYPSQYLLAITCQLPYDCYNNLTLLHAPLDRPLSPSPHSNRPTTDPSPATPRPPHFPPDRPDRTSAFAHRTSVEHR